MDSLIHIITTIVTIVFIAAVLYSLTSALRKRHRKAKVQQELAKKEHVKVANLHQYDIKPNDGYYKYPIEEKGKLRRFPQHFTAVALELANEQPYSVCLLALAEFDHGELKDTRYFYIRPPENNLSAVKGRYQWDELSKADEFGEYWQAGLKNLIESQTLVAHNAPFVMGCLTHALHIYGIDAPAFCYADTLEVAKKLYHFPSNQLDVICDEMDIQTEEGNLLSQAIADRRQRSRPHRRRRTRRRKAERNVRSRNTGPGPHRRPGTKRLRRSRRKTRHILRHRQRPGLL